MKVIDSHQSKQGVVRKPIPSFRRHALTALVLFTLPGMQLPAQADGLRTTSCVGGRSSFNCVTRWKSGLSDPHIVKVPGARLHDPNSQERDRRWQSRCRPVVRQDDFGVFRYGYAAQGCEYGKLD